MEPRGLSQANRISSSRTEHRMGPERVPSSTELLTRVETSVASTHPLPRRACNWSRLALPASEECAYAHFRRHGGPKGTSRSSWTLPSTTRTRQRDHMFAERGVIKRSRASESPTCRHAEPSHSRERRRALHDSENARKRIHRWRGGQVSASCKPCVGGGASKPPTSQPA